HSVKGKRHKKRVLNIPCLVTYETYISKCLVVVISVLSSIIIPNATTSDNSFQISSSIVLAIAIRNSCPEISFVYVINPSEIFGVSDSFIISIVEGKSRRGKLFFDKKYTTQIICLTFASDKKI